jgi:Flp pilus assembly protein TadG
MRIKPSRFYRDESGVANLLVTLYVMPVMLFMAFAAVPFFVYFMKGVHLQTAASHALQEAEKIGYASPAVIANTNARLASLGIGGVAVGGVTYPSYAGSTAGKVLFDAADPTVTIVLEYPAPSLTKFLFALGGGGGSSGNGDGGYYHIVVSGRSDAIN